MFSQPTSVATSRIYYNEDADTHHCGREHMEDTDICLVASEEIAATAGTEPPGLQGFWGLHGHQRTAAASGTSAPSLSTT